MISEKWSIGQSMQGNEIWALRVSDNPDVDEDEPEVLIDGMHHAREIMASEFPMMFAEYLAANYGVDSEITWLVDNRELYIVPIVNPDGQLYNEQDQPLRWRHVAQDPAQQRRRHLRRGSQPQLPLHVGLRQQRQQPVRQRRDLPRPQRRKRTLRPGLHELRERARDHHARLRAHLQQTCCFYPWGYTSSPCPDDALFENMAAIMTQENGYEYGPPGEILYSTNGGNFDWMYAATDEHPMVLSFSSEIGGNSDGFWPDQDRRQPLFEENIWPHIYLMRSAGTFIAVNSPVVVGDTRTILPGQSGYLDFTIENQSALASALNLGVTVTCDDAWVQLGASEFNVGDLAAQSSTTLGAGNLPVSVDEGCPDGHLVPFQVVVHMEEGDLAFDLAFMVGTPNSIFAR